MRYGLYLIGCFLLVGLGATCPLMPSGARLDFFNLLSLLDAQTLAFLLAACILGLLGTGSLRAFGQAIRSMFQKEKLSDSQTRESLMACQQVTTVSLLAGGLGFLIALIKMMHSLDGVEPESVGISLNVACLSLGYALFLNLLLLPVGNALKKRLGELEQDEKDNRSRGTISVRKNHRKAG